MATKRIIQLPTLNNWQVTWGNSSQGGFLRKLPNELPWWDWPNPKNVIQTPQTDANGNITGWWWKKTAMNSPEEPEVWTYRGNNGVVQTINKNTTPTNWWFTQYSSKTDRSAAVMNANKNGTTSSLPQATPANLPWVTKYAGIDKTAEGISYWNNQAGIDLVNKQNELDTLSKAEKAQRLAGMYKKIPLPWQKEVSVVSYKDNPDWTTTNYLSDWTTSTVKYTVNPDWSYTPTEVSWQPTPTVATAQNPVIKKTMDKPQEQTVTPAAIQGADINTLNSTLDELKYKVNVEGKQLTKEEYMTFESARRQLQDMMKPKEYTWFENVINDTKNLIETTKKEESASNAEELARYTESQDKRKESQLAILNEQEMTSKKRLASILWWSGQWQSTDTGEQFKALEDSFTLRKQEKINEMQDRVDLYGATLRKDSKETIQALEKRLADQQMKVVDIDLKNLDIINAYNEKQWLSQLEKIDKLQQMAADIIANNTPLTDQQKADAAMRSNKIIKPDWTFDRELWEILKKQNPMIAAEAVRQSTAIQNERIQSELAMKWLDADIKKAQLNKLLNPDVDWKDSGKVDVNGNPILYDPKNPTNTRTLPITWTSIDRDQATKSYWTTPAVRNFNPWNIMDTAFWGQKVEWERFTRFDTPQQWFNALVSKIENIQAGNSKVYSPNMTLLQYISKYAPASDNNNPQAYASQIAKKLWVSIDTTIWQLDPVKLASAHAQHEDKNSYKMLLDLWVITQDGSLWVAKATNLTPEKQTAIQDALFAIEDLEKTTWKEWAVGYSRQKNLNTLIPWGENKFIAGTPAANFEAKFNRLTNMLTLPNLDKLKGAMSDKDIAFLKSASSALNLNMSEKEFDQTLKDVKEKFQNMLWVQPQEQTQTKTVTKTWTTKDWKKVVQYSDWTIEYQ